MTALIFAGNGEEAGIPFQGSPVAVPDSTRICLGWSGSPEDGQTLIFLDVAGATWAWIDQLERAVREVATGDIVPARLPQYEPEASPA